MKKRVLSLAVALMMTIVVLPTFAVAVQAAEPHPLAIALRDYMAGNIVVRNPYISEVLGIPDDRVSTDIRSAQLVTLDDNGTLGVLLTIDDGMVSRVLLYMYNNELVYMLGGWSAYGFFTMGINNRVASSPSSAGDVTNIYKLEAGEMVISTSWVDASWTDGVSFSFNGQRVTENEFNIFRDRAVVRYGMGDSWEAVAASWGEERADQTDQILAMTVNDTPSLTGPATAPAQAQNNAINVTVDGTAVNFTGQQPTIINGRTLVPVRGVFEALDFDVSWNGQARQVTLSRANDTIVITIDSASFTANGASHALDVPAQIIGGSTMIPLRAVLESVGYGLAWDENTQTVIISTSHPIPLSRHPQSQALDM